MGNLCKKLHSSTIQQPPIRIQLNKMCNEISPDLWPKGVDKLGKKIFSFLRNDNTGILKDIDPEKIFAWFTGDVNFKKFYTTTYSNGELPLEKLKKKRNSLLGFTPTDEGKNKDQTIITLPREQKKRRTTDSCDSVKESTIPAGFKREKSFTMDALRRIKK